MKREALTTLNMARRDWLATGGGLAAAAITGMFPELQLRGEIEQPPQWRLPPRAKRVIYLYQAGAPSQLDLFDYKPETLKRHNEELPPSVRGAQRLTAFTKDQPRLPIAASPFRFSRHGRAGIWLSELLTHHREIADLICVVHSVHTEAINHVNGASLAMTGSERAGRPSMGAWVDYGLGRLTEELPAFVVLSSCGSAWHGGEAIQARYWANGFLPAEHQGVKFRSSGSPVLFLDDPPGVSRTDRRRWLNAVQQLNQVELSARGDQATRARMEQFETAFQMQAAAPEAFDMSTETTETMRLYGEPASQPGTFAANCLLARRLAERGVRFIQLFHRGWDHHSNINQSHPLQARDIDQPVAALVLDLKRRGLLDETLVVFGSEFGRTVFCQGELSQPDYGRDHHPRCFTVWLAGGGIRGGFQYGRTDDFSYNVVADPVHVHDLNATILHCLGLDHERLTARHNGRDMRLTDVGGRVVRELLR
ncbi:MAG: DUF1501 domain-containing protein [Pirellulaceae bacterium]|jgi:hypothetical protein|nr:DUF1501 domain-containing protein [Pirellulaceae bacterium]MDP7018555.1 DUF1501 domain-containing protein [Pirellulaceae bacterium]